LENYSLERIQRVFAGIVEEFIMGLKKRERIHEKMVCDYLENK